MAQDQEQRGAKTPPTTEFAFDTLTALLGGAAASAVLPDDLPARAAVIAALDGPHAWLTPGVDGRAPDPRIVRQLALEVSSLKLRAFVCICRAWAQGGWPAAEITGRLHLDATAPAPVRWRIEMLVRPRDGGAAPAPVDRELGLILARLLWRNDERPPEAAVEAAECAAQRFARGIGQAPGRPEDLARALLAEVGVADSALLLYDAGRRRRVDRAPLPPPLWTELGMLALCLASGTGPLTVPTDSIAQAAGAAADHAQALVHRIGVEAFAAWVRQDDLRDVLRAALGDRDTDS
jgi:hypothetical protein